MLKEHIIKVATEKCIGCGLCKRDCPVNNINIIDDKAIIKAQDCIKCGHCVAICPKAAISMTGFDEQPEEITEQVTLEPEKLMKAIKTRRSIRQFKDKEVSDEIIKKIIQAGRWTPTAKNTQDISYVVIKEQMSECERIAVQVLKKIKAVVGLFNKTVRDITIDDNFFFKKAPVAIAIISRDSISASMAAANMGLLAESFNLGVLYSGFFSRAVNLSKKLRRKLKLKRKDKVVTTLVLGYPNVKYYRTVQKEAAVTEYI